MKLPPEVNLLAVSHYLQALDYQRYANQVVGDARRQDAATSRTSPSAASPNAINLDSDADAEHVEAVSDEGPARRDASRSSQKVYFPDVCAIAAMYPTGSATARGVTNYLSVPDLPLDTKGTKFDLPGGIILNGDLVEGAADHRSEDPYLRKNVSRRHRARLVRRRRPAASVRRGDRAATTPTYEGRRQVLVGQGAALRRAARCRSVRSRRCSSATRRGTADGEVGRRRRSKIAGPIAKSEADAGHAALDARPPRARAMIRTAVLSELAAEALAAAGRQHRQGRHRDLQRAGVPEGGASKAFGFHEAPRGTLSHWVVIDDGKIKNYQAVVPTTWNAGPRDAKDRRDPTKRRWSAIPIADAERPLEVLRTVHSFDPCMACAIHTFDVDGTRFRG